MSVGAVFDCVVFLQGAGRRTSPAAACFQLVDAGRVQLFVSAAVLLEIRDVFHRPPVRRRFPELTDEWVESFVQNAELRAVCVNEVPLLFHFPRDPHDEPYINLALAAGAQFLVSRDNDLLDLMNDADFRARFPSLSILDPVAFLREMAKIPSSQSGSDTGPASS